MQCFVPSCKNTSGNLPSCKGISFHCFPSEEHLRAAWLRALGKQGSLLPEFAVICSQHFLSDDICVTENGIRQIAIGAMPSLVQVCMICFDTESKLLPMSRHRLKEAYENLTGHTLCDQGQLKQTLCVQCAQRLLNSSKFKDQSLRSYALIMDLVEQYELITQQHIKIINSSKHRLNNNMVVATLGSDHCDLHITEHSIDEEHIKLEDTHIIDHPIDEKDIKLEDTHIIDHPIDEKDIKLEGTHIVKHIIDKDHIKLEDTHTTEHAIDEEDIQSKNARQSTEVKIEEGYHSLSVCVDMELKNKEYSNEDNIKIEFAKVPLNCENASLQCSICLEEFVQEQEYMQHMSMHLQNNKHDDEYDTTEVCISDRNVSSGSHSSLIFKNKQDVQTLDKDSSDSAPLTQPLLIPVRDILAIKDNVTVAQSGDLDNVSFSQKKLPECFVQLRDVFLNRKIISKRRKSIRRKRNLSATTTPTMCHTGDEPYSCTFCLFKSVKKTDLDMHMRTHATEKPYLTEVPVDSCAQKRILVDNSSSHPDDKPYSCELCTYKSGKKYDLVRHLRTHTGDKLYSCALCIYKCTQKHRLVTHVRTHTGEKPYSCEQCVYKCARKSDLLRHMATHTGQKPYSCEFCIYKCSRKSLLAEHMIIHTGQKPYSCKLCDYKCARKRYLGDHMKTHTDEKRYSCALCDYKCTRKTHFVGHINTHTGEKPYSCKLCDYKCAHKTNLVSHMRIHTGERPYSCELCAYKFAQRHHLVRHMKTHSDSKP